MSNNIDIIREIEKSYDLQVDSIYNLNGGFLNKKRIIESDNKKIVAKIMSLQKFDLCHLKILIPNVTQLMIYLSANGLKCPNIYKTKINENYLLFDSNYVLLMSFIDGITKKCDDITFHEIYSLGKEVAKMHLLLKKYNDFNKNYNFMNLKSVDDLLFDLNKRIHAKSHNKKYFLDISLHAKIIKDIRDSKLLDEIEIQLIHGDLTFDNILFKNNELIGILDFELVRYNSVLQDIGRVLLSFTLDYNGKLDVKKIDIFLNGYNTITKLTIDDVIKAFKIVWVNEVHLWIKSDYYNNKNTKKVEKFIQEINWITNNWFDLEKIIRRENHEA